MTWNSTPLPVYSQVQLLELTGTGTARQVPSLEASSHYTIIDVLQNFPEEKIVLHTDFLSSNIH